MSSMSLEGLKDLLSQTEKKISQLEHDLNNALGAKLMLEDLIRSKEENYARESS